MSPFWKRHLCKFRILYGHAVSFTFRIFFQVWNMTQPLFLCELILKFVLRNALRESSQCFECEWISNGMKPLKSDVGGAFLCSFYASKNTRLPDRAKITLDSSAMSTLIVCMPINRMSWFTLLDPTLCLAKFQGNFKVHWLLLHCRYSLVAIKRPGPIK